jgi:hypothetical protein
VKPLFVLAMLIAASALAAEPPREMHGSGDGFAMQGITLAWAIERGKSEADTKVVVRVSVDTKQYPWVSVKGVDPFTKGELVEQQPTMIPNMLDVRLPRAKFADYPNTEFRFYPSEAAARKGEAAVVVFYHGVPDTAPEFTNDVALDNYLIKRVVEQRK